MKINTPLRSSLRRTARRGFTLVELLLVLVILGTLAAIVLPKFTGVGDRAKRKAAGTQINTFKTVLSAFEVDNGFYPKELMDLIVQPRDATSWHGPYLEATKIPTDPWGNDYIYVNPGKQNTSGYDIISMGLDGKEGTDDDINSWEPAKE